VEKKKNELTVETPWGKVVSASGMETIARGFSQDLEKIQKAITKINMQLKDGGSSKGIDDLKPTLDSLAERVENLEKETLSRIKTVEEAHEKTRTELREFMELTRKTLRLFKERLDI
jgi:predicted  nucleic acid-binding Zn-ribbon protein